MLVLGVNAQLVLQLLHLAHQWLQLLHLALQLLHLALQLLQHLYDLLHTIGLWHIRNERNFLRCSL
jgi:hypothetical protein